MQKESETKILAMLDEKDLVLDVGGWACPFNRANWVLDFEPHDTRGFYATIGMPSHQGGEREYFSPATWVQRDICEKTPWPFSDKQFDFSICSHVLEDIRDPLFVCAELIRVSRRGYIEIPSRLLETCRGWEPTGTAGLSHHRWLIDVEGSHLQFTPKFHMINTEFDLAFPTSFLRKLKPDEIVSTLWWNDSFTYAETMIHGLDNQAAFLRDYVRRRYRYPAYRIAARDIVRRSQRGLTGIRQRLRLRSRLGLR